MVQLDQARQVQLIESNLNFVFKFKLVAMAVANDFPQILQGVSLIVAEFMVFVLYFLHEDVQGLLLECLHLNQNDDEALSRTHLKDYQLG